MTVAMKVKLTVKLQQLLKLVTLAGITQPMCPSNACNDLITALTTDSYTVLQLNDMEHSLAVFYGGLLSGKVKAEDDYLVEVVYCATSSLCDLLRRYSRIENKDIPTVPSSDVQEILAWDSFITVYDEVRRKWLAFKGYDVYNPIKFFEQECPTEFSHLTFNERDRLEAAAIPDSVGDLLSASFRNAGLSRSCLATLSLNSSRLSKLCYEYDFNGVAWKHFYDSTGRKIDVSIGIAIAADISRVKAAYMEYKSIVFRLCLN